MVLKLLDFAILARVATEVISGGQWGTVPGKWSHAVKPDNLLKAARVVTHQMKNRSKKLFSHCRKASLLASSVMFTPKSKTQKKSEKLNCCNSSCGCSGGVGTIIS